MLWMVGQFVGILWVVVLVEGYDELVEGLQGLFSYGICVFLVESGIELVCNWKFIYFDLVGNDCFGIVCDIIWLLVEYGVNLESLFIEVCLVLMSSELLFYVDVLLVVLLILLLDILCE